MSLTVKQLAKVVGTPVDRLMIQFKEAGVFIETEDSPIAPQDKQTLLAYLRRGTASSASLKETHSERITITRRSVSQIKVAAPKKPGGRTAESIVNVEVRKKRTYIKRKPVLEQEQQGESETQVETLQTKVVEAKVETPISEPVEGKEIPSTEAPQKETEILSQEEKQKQEEDRLKREREEFERRKVESKFLRKLKARAKREADEEAGEETHIAPLFDLKHRLGSEKTQRKEKRKTPKEVEVEDHLLAISKHGFERPTARIMKEISIPETVTIAQLAERMSVKASEVIQMLIKMGIMATINQAIDQDTATLLVEEMGHKVKLVRSNVMEESLLPQTTSESDGPRAPVVAIMGHVDHGKTSLLDVIRRTQVHKNEAGGITQRIGAYSVHVDRGDITFLDTPGHAAFTAMRARGAQCTDIVVLVVAADDGVMPQTEEAIAHARAADVSIVVAVNKMDKPGASLDRVQQELAKLGILSEEWGGQVLFVPVSAKTGQGIDKLLEAILLQTELEELKAPMEGPAKGVIIESSLDKGRGPVATVLVQSGRLQRGDILLAGTEYGRVRALLDETGAVLEAVGPSKPVEVLGLSGVPNAGDMAFVVADEKKARQIASLRYAKIREAQLAKTGTSIENLFAERSGTDTKILNVAIKADIQGSMEALREALNQISNPDVKITIVHQGVGGINESDIHLAKASRALMIGFNVRAETAARRLAEAESVPIYYYSVIYDVITEVTKTAKNLVPPKMKEVILGVAEVRNVFTSSKLGAIAGCMVTDGVVKRNYPIRVLRNQIVIYQGELESLRRFKEDASEVHSGLECGIGVRNYKDVKIGDQIEVYGKVEIENPVTA